MNIKAVVCDLGGVLFEDGGANAVKKLVKEYAYDKDVVMNIYRSPQAMDLRTGRMRDEEFWHWAQTHLPPGYDACTIQRAWYDGYVLDEGIVTLLKKLHKRYKCIIFFR